MRFASLGSGSAGNALVVEEGETRVLLDCGFSLKEACMRLERLGLEAAALSAILITHEHDDHLGGAFRLAAKFRIPIFMTHGTLAVARDLPAEVTAHLIDSHTPFAIRDLEIHPFPVPHDAREPVQFVLGNGAKRLGVLTDTGCSTPHIEAMLSGCDALMLECNHDLEMLMGSDYPKSLKQRISGKLGHLDNETSAQLLSRLNRDRLQHIVAAHLSERNNRPELARAALSRALGCEASWIAVADQANGIGWLGMN